MFSSRYSNGSRRSFSGSGRGGRSSGRGGRGGFRRGYGGHDDLSGAMGRMSFGSSTDLKIPPLSAFAFGSAEEAFAGESVESCERVAPAEDIPLNYQTPSAYLTAMQAHNQKEFEASVRQGISNADREEGGGWLPLTCRQKPGRPKNELSFYVDGTPTNKEIAGRSDDGDGHNFKQDPWSRHMIQFEGESVPALVFVCGNGFTDYQAFLGVAPGGGGVPARYDGFETRVRSFGYVGSFLREYISAAELRKNLDSPLLLAVAAPGRHGHDSSESSGSGGSFVPRGDVRTLDTSSVPLNSTQGDAVLNLAGGLDLIVGPPGTGKSTTIYHVIQSRVQKGARVLITSIRNQAIDAVTEKVDPFGVLVFGSEARLGPYAKEFTMAGRMRNDPELVFWRQRLATWTKTLQVAEAVSWKELHLLPTFHGIKRLRDLEEESFRSGIYPRSSKGLQLSKSGKAAGRWAFALESVLKTNYYQRLKRGNSSQRLMLRQLHALDKFKALLRDGHARVTRILMRLEALTRFRIYTETRVLICTVDSTERMLRNMEEGTQEAALAVGSIAGSSALSYRLTLDTAIMDEAACVMETSIPVVLALGIKNLLLVGDHHQLQPFSQIRENDAGKHHNRSLMERCISAGRTHEFLDTQYRMHPSLSQIVSTTFYDNKLKTADSLKLKRRSYEPCKWVHVSGGEIKHQGRGYSNPFEIPKVVEQVRAARRQYGRDADIRVITFYNMQRRDLEREFKCHADLGSVRIASVDSCQGSDADVVIISTVRSGDVGYRLSGFMLDPRRVNVALSRAKEECIIVGDKHTLRSGGGAMWRSVADHFTS